MPQIVLEGQGVGGEWQEGHSVGMQIPVTVGAGTGIRKHSLSWGISVETGPHHKQIALFTVMARELLTLGTLTWEEIRTENW